MARMSPTTLQNCSEKQNLFIAIIFLFSLSSNLKESAEVASLLARL